MIFQEWRQSDTSPLKYVLELTSEELEQVKDLVIQIIERTKKDEEN
jgi:hypothetical protein